MSEIKRERFFDFASSVLPHEVDYLERIQKLKDAENLQILMQVRRSTLNPEEPAQFDKSIDKRKYSYMKKWITQKLNAIDADRFFFHMTELDSKIMTDAIGPEDEKALLGLIHTYKSTGYYFIRFYELVQNYRYYLLIRMRYNYLKPINNFLENWKQAYNHAKNVNQELHEATIDIVDQYASYKKESRQWEERLISIFNDEALDGLNRYYAIVRLTFMYYNYKQYDKLIGLYKHLDELIVNGHIYSKRILVNYYANKVLLHARNNELDKAVYYGLLSIRWKSADYMFYLSNLCAVLLRSDRNKLALKMMKDNLPELKNTVSPHNRIGFASFYIQSLVRNNKATQALSYANTFLERNREDILQFRWHLFFSSMIQSMLRLEKYAEVIKTVKKYELLKREAEHRNRAGYLPAITWYYQVARYKECLIDEAAMLESFIESAELSLTDAHKNKLLSELIAEIKPHVMNLPEKLLNL